MPAYTVSRSRLISAPPEAVYDLLRNFHRWPEWSPWLACEPDARLQFAPDGSRYTWEGKVVGSGSIAVTSEARPTRIEHDLAFVRPFKSRSRTGFQLSREGGGTHVQWTVEGSLPLFLFWLKPMITALLGMDFERGLRRLAAVLEHGKVPATLTFIGFTQTPATAYLAITADCAIRDIGASMQDAYARLAASARHAGVNPAGPCFSIYHRWDLTRGEGRYSACMPVTSPPAALSDGLVAGQRPARRTYAVQLTGPFDYLADAWAAGFGRAKAGLFKQSKAHAPFEVYEKTPETHPGEASVTTLYFPAA